MVEEDPSGQLPRLLLWLRLLIFFFFVVGVDYVILSRDAAGTVGGLLGCCRDRWSTGRSLSAKVASPVVGFCW